MSLFMTCPSLKGFEEDKIDATKIMGFHGKFVENIVKKKENAVYQHFSFFSHCAFNPILHMPILGYSNSAASKDMMTKI